MVAWYNEIDVYAAEWLRNLIGERLIADGEVDTRSIADVRADDLVGFDQCHFFAGIGGWSLALRRAGWPDARPVWTGSCPCQPFSLLGKQAGYADPRHLWPTWARLIGERRPATVFGEQLATAARWLRLVRGDLEALGYAVGSLPIEAACADAEQLRDRVWFVARHQASALVNGFEPGLERYTGHVDQARAESQAARSAAASGFQFGSGALADSAGLGSGTGLREGFAIIDGSGAASGRREFDLAICRIDGRVRRVKPGLRLVADGSPARVDKLRALGNAIDHRPAAAFIRAAMQSIGG
ncbi:DNA cytosine methyltransferase [Bradyrhizobium septentrionale]|uniref:DNA cytosine methyltransferase n=1 Tax=Bradyrhizobium septentrionale TaxID=1404411 RepID=A0ABZ2P999_9BRAD